MGTWTGSAVVRPTISTDAYSADDVIGGLLEFVVASAGGGGVLQQVLLVDAAEEAAALGLYLFSGMPSEFEDGDPFEPTADDLAMLVGVVALKADDYETVNNLAYQQVGNIGLVYTVHGRYLYGYLVAGATPDYDAADDLAIKIVFRAD